MALPHLLSNRSNERARTPVQPTERLLRRSFGYLEKFKIAPKSPEFGVVDDGKYDSNSIKMYLQAILLPLITLSVVLLGLGLIIVTALLPCLLYVSLLSSDNQCDGSMALQTLSLLLQVQHLRLLWSSTAYLAFFRKMLLPFRRLIVPLVMQVARIESIREQEPTLFFDTTTTTNNRDVSDLLKSLFRKSVRRRYESMRAKFQRAIRHEALDCETSLNLSTVVPILWQHEQRAAATSGKNVLEEFIKRFLVVSIMPDGILDCYYYHQDNKLVALQLSILQDNMLHWFMYFSIDTTCGIWFHGILLSFLRALQTEGVDYVNGQVHQTESKVNAGFVACNLDDSELLSRLYPSRATTRPMPASMREVSLWSSYRVE